MCRLTIYKGKPMLIGDIATNPDNSLIYQSRDAAYHPGVTDKTGARNILVNGDGFGVAWYGSEPRKGSCCFKFVTPAWSNSNLRSIGEHVASHLICAHIRAASSGHDPLHERVMVSHENCHPFKFRRFTFMHNGGIPYFNKIKLPILNMLGDPFFNELKGSTDSEHIFMLVLRFLHKGDLSRENFSVEEMAQALTDAINTVIGLCQDAEIEEACSLNLCLTDGVNVLATRFRNGPQSPPSLYYNFGKDFKCDERGHFYSSGSGLSEHLVVSSAPLSKVDDCGFPCESTLCGSTGELRVCDEDESGDWVLIPKDHMLIGHGDPANLFRVASVELRPIATGPAPRAAKKVVPAEPKSAGASASQPVSVKGSGPATVVHGHINRKPKIMRFRSKL